MILGTSPLLLIEGLLRARTGEQVVFFEASDRLGGAWRQVAFGEVEDVEGACHLIENYRGVAAFLEDEVGIPLEVCNPVPLVREGDGRLRAYNSWCRQGRRFLPCMGKSVLVALIRAVEGLSLGRFRLPRTRRYCFADAGRTLGALIRQPFLASEHSRAIRYPVAGAPARLKRLEDELISLDAVFVRGDVESLNLPGVGRPSVRLRDGPTFVCRTVVFSESVSISNLDLGSHCIPFDIERHVCRPLVVEVAGAGRKLCS